MTSQPSPVGTAAIACSPSTVNIIAGRAQTAGRIDVSTDSLAWFTLNEVRTTQRCVPAEAFCIRSTAGTETGGLGFTAVGGTWTDEAFLWRGACAGMVAMGIVAFRRVPCAVPLDRNMAGRYCGPDSGTATLGGNGSGRSA